MEPVPAKKLKQLRPLPKPWHLGGSESRIFPAPLPPPPRVLSAYYIPDESQLRSLPLSFSSDDAPQSHLAPHSEPVPTQTVPAQPHVPAPVPKTSPTASRTVNGGGGGHLAVPLGPHDGSDGGMEREESGGETQGGWTADAPTLVRRSTTPLPGAEPQHALAPDAPHPIPRAPQTISTSRGLMPVRRAGDPGRAIFRRGFDCTPPPHPHLPATPALTQSPVLTHQPSALPYACPAEKKN